MPVFVTIPMIFLASKKEFHTEWENGCQKFRSERIKEVYGCGEKGHGSGLLQLESDGGGCR